jgi:hypothetical protein
VVAGPGGLACGCDVAALVRWWAMVAWWWAVLVVLDCDVAILLRCSWHDVAALLTLVGGDGCGSSGRGC